MIPQIGSAHTCSAYQRQHCKREFQEEQQSFFIHSELGAGKWSVQQKRQRSRLKEISPELYQQVHHLTLPAIHSSLP